MLKQLLASKWKKENLDSGFLSKSTKLCTSTQKIITTYIFMTLGNIESTLHT